MLVRELIERLQQVDPTGELEVIVADEGGDDNGVIITGVDEDDVLIFSDDGEHSTTKHVVIIEFSCDAAEQYQFPNQLSQHDGG